MFPFCRNTEKLPEYWFGLDFHREETLVKTTLHRGGGLEGRFIVNKCLLGKSLKTKFIDLPKCIFPSGNISIEQFPNRQLTKSVLAAVLVCSSQSK